MKTKNIERIWIEQGAQPWIIIFTAEVDGNFIFREEVARFNFYSKYGYTKLEYGTDKNGFEKRKEYKGFKPILNSLFKVDERLSWDTRMVDNAKKAAKEEEKRSIKEAEERHAMIQAEQRETATEQPSTEEHQPEQTNAYIAYNRTFPTYEEAVNYCNDSDFDLALIEAVGQPVDSHVGDLKMDLQLFGTIVEVEEKPFKRPYASYENGVSKFGIGKHLELVFALETTKEDPKLDVMYYSNINKYEFNNLHDVLERFNLYQQLGYHNLQLWSEIRYKGNTIIENGTDGQLEFMINDSRLKEAKKTQKENEQLKQQIEMYDAFIKKYKAEDSFNKYVNEEKTISI